MKPIYFRKEWVDNMKKLALFNQKGGCAKTTSVVNIAGYMAKMGRKVLVVDCDPQANATQFLLMENEPVTDTIVSAISGEKDLKEVIVQALIRTRGNANPKYLDIDVIPAERSMAVAELADEYVLKNLLEHIEDLSKQKFMPGKEYGTAHWDSAEKITKKFSNKKKPEENRLYSEKIRISINTRKTRINNNVLVIGGSGVGKSQFLAKPQLYQANTSFVVTDPKKGICVR